MARELELRCIDIRNEDDGPIATIAWRGLSADPRRGSAHDGGGPGSRSLRTDPGGLSGRGLHPRCRAGRIGCTSTA
jgi:hypothetical protein